MKIWFCSDYCYFAELGKAPVKVAEPNGEKACSVCNTSLMNYELHFYATPKEVANVA